MDSSTFFGLSTVAYILAMMTYITYLAFKKTTIGIVATAITITGFISQTLALAFIDMSGMSTNIQPLVPALQSNWLLVHVMMSFTSYALFSISFSTGLM